MSESRDLIAAVVAPGWQMPEAANMDPATIDQAIAIGVDSYDSFLFDFLGVPFVGTFRADKQDTIFIDIF